MIEVLVALLVGTLMGFAGTLEIGRREKARKQKMETEKITVFLSGFMAAAMGVPEQGDGAAEWRDGWNWFHDLQDKVYAERTAGLRSLH